MGDPDLVAMLDHWIAQAEKHKDEQISELVAAHKESSLYTVEDALEDPQLQSICKILEDLTLLRQKVIDGETS